jgi:hypothetical protein
MAARAASATLCREISARAALRRLFDATVEARDTSDTQVAKI